MKIIISEAGSSFPTTLAWHSRRLRPSHLRDLQRQFPGIESVEVITNDGRQLDTAALDFDAEQNTLVLRRDTIRDTADRIVKILFLGRRRMEKAE